MGRRNKKWSELSGGQRTGVVLGSLVQMTLQGLALRDLAKRPAEQVKGPKAAWMLATLVNGLGPIAYFIAGRRRAPRGVTQGSGTTASSSGLHTAAGVGLGKKL